VKKKDIKRKGKKGNKEEKKGYGKER